ncbi:heat shock 70 kDa protein, putative, partial [Entamoeba invadens IP1]
HERKVEEVVLVGGSTKIPKIETMVQQYFGRKPCKDVDPDKAVATGAALHAASLNGQATEIGKLVDVTAKSLGIEICETNMEVVIGKFKSIPCKESKTFVTDQDNQDFARFCVFEGESEKTENNEYLDGFTISGLPKLKKGKVKFRVTFTVDVNALLTVSAVVVEPKALSDLQGHCNVQTQRERMSEETILMRRAMIDKMDKIDDENLKKSVAEQQYKKLVRSYQEKTKNDSKACEVSKKLTTWWNESFSSSDSESLMAKLHDFEGQLNSI